ncbi:exonuclease domain-containing protein [Methanomethylophilus alvi]|uniref:exonuclease domain-containing protein n=1 Tax=Methanomethylophilus alvi TaxID=1291540 RepID=UPI0037DC80C6
MVLIIDTETTGLSGYPKDRVLEIGIAELEGGSVKSVYSEIIRYSDIVEFDTQILRMLSNRNPVF